MYEFAGSKSAKLVVREYGKISSPDSSVYCLACLCEYPNKSSHILRWFYCLLQFLILINRHPFIICRSNK
jgi:hypothetical protein